MEEENYANQCDPKDEMPSRSWDTSNRSQRRQPQPISDGRVEYNEPCNQAEERSHCFNYGHPSRPTMP